MFAKFPISNWGNCWLGCWDADYCAGGCWWLHPGPWTWLLCDWFDYWGVCWVWDGKLDCGWGGWFGLTELWGFIIPPNIDINPPIFKPPKGFCCCCDDVDWLVVDWGCPVSAESKPEIEPDPRLNVWLKIWGWLWVCSYSLLSSSISSLDWTMIVAWTLPYIWGF